jgi:hypothetical protein
MTKSSAPRTIVKTSIRILFTVFLCARPSALIAEESLYLSDPESDLRIAVVGIAALTQPEPEAKVVPRSTEMLLFGLSTVTNADTVIAWAKEPEYLCRAELTDAAGHSVGKKKMGRLYGSKYADFKTSQGNLVRQHIGPGSEPSWNLFRPSDLFEITRPGNYNLRLYFQVVKVETSSVTNPAKIVKFPALSIPVLEQAK